MPRARTERIHEFKATLLARLGDGFHRPGQRFLSTRALADRYGVSFQTVHRVVGELVDEGRLTRRAGSGTYVAGDPAEIRRVRLVFHPRARRPDSFGYHLHVLLVTALDQAGLEHETTFGEEPSLAIPEAYPVFWETPGVAGNTAREHRYGLLLNDSPPPGIAGSYIDSVTTDNYSGGMCAAEVLTGFRQVAVVAGPKGDLRSQQRVDGFRALRPDASIVRAGSWDASAGEGIAKRIPSAVDGCFCVNDRLTSGLISRLSKMGRIMPVVGFDDAPLAEPLGLTTIAIPWESLVGGAVSIIRRRLGGDTSNGRQQIFAPRPVLRKTHL